MEHMKEPWGVWNHDGDWTIEAMSKKAGCMVDIANASFSEQDSRRIVACVNACEGIDNSTLEIPGYSIKAELDSLDNQINGRLKAEQQREKLLKAITQAGKDYINQNGSKPEWWTPEIAQIVIENIEGK